MSGKPFLACYSLNDRKAVGLAAAGAWFTSVGKLGLDSTWPFPVVGYGKTWSRGIFTCRSAMAGITCRIPSGHGLFINRTKRRKF
jgi:hypothetical protein